MSGFFDKNALDTSDFHKGKRVGCYLCSLKAKGNIRDEVVGKFKKGIINILEFTEGSIRSFFDTPAGMLLTNIYQDAGIDIIEDCLNLVAIRCVKSPKDIEESHVLNCRAGLLTALKINQPKLIISFGTVSLKSLMGGRLDPVGELEKWRGHIIPDQLHKCWLSFVYSPSYASPKRKNSFMGDNDKQEAILQVWKTDIQKALSHVGKPWQRDKTPQIEIIEDLRPLNKIKSDIISIDYETTGIKPHAKGHRIVCVSVADTVDHCYAFMLPDNKQGREPFLNLLKNESVNKMAHNMKFEEAWSICRLRQPVMGWYWDSMLAAHILDNRPGITGLKFQTYINFGIQDYSTEVSPYLKSGEKHANSLNSIQKLLTTFGGREKLLTYCGMDTIYQYRLAVKQMELMGYDDLPF